MAAPKKVTKIKPKEPVVHSGGMIEITPIDDLKVRIILQVDQIGPIFSATNEEGQKGTAVYAIIGQTCLTYMARESPEEIKRDILIARGLISLTRS